MCSKKLLLFIFLGYFSLTYSTLSKYVKEPCYLKQETTEPGVK